MKRFATHTHTHTYIYIYISTFLYFIFLSTRFHFLFLFFFLDITVPRKQSLAFKIPSRFLNLGAWRRCECGLGVVRYRDPPVYCHNRGLAFLFFQHKSLSEWDCAFPSLQIFKAHTQLRQRCCTKALVKTLSHDICYTN